MQYHSMGPGPLWTLYRPYHLCNLETPLTVAKAVIDKEPTIIPIDGPVSECITVAKRDLKAGEYIDGIGGYTTYGSIATSQETYEKGYVIYGLINKKHVCSKTLKRSNPHYGYGAARYKHSALSRSSGTGCYVRQILCKK